jgi:hypothetical protein
VSARKTPPLIAVGTAQTTSGRTLAYPRLKGTFRQRLRDLDAWLLAEAVTEARAQGNHFAADIFASYRPTGKPPMLDAHRAELNEFLFDPASRLPMDPILWREFAASEVLA